LLIGGEGNDYLQGDFTGDTALAGQYHGDDTLDGGAGDDNLKAADDYNWQRRLVA
jgi:Ca2+-binding RTX toxin-like protein